MTTLSKNVPRTYNLGNFNQHPVVASDIIFNGAVVGESAGHARPLVGGDRFLGFAKEQADNSVGAAGDVSITVAKCGEVELTITGLVAADLNLPVYASDDDTFSLSPVGGTFIGFVSMVEAPGVGVVAFDVSGYRDPWAGYLAETVSDNLTVDYQDQGKLFVVTVDAKVITLPAVAGNKFVVMNGGADGTIAVNISPNANDGIGGPNLTAVDNKDLINTKVTARRGDHVMIEYGDATGWIVTKIVGVWVKEA